MCYCYQLTRAGIAAEKKRKALQERRIERERRIEGSLVIWEKEIVPDWRVVHKNPNLRRLWWGGIPTKLRASMWERAVGNSLALSKGRYLADPSSRFISSARYSIVSRNFLTRFFIQTIIGLVSPVQNAHSILVFFRSPV